MREVFNETSHPDEGVSKPKSIKEVQERAKTTNGYLTHNEVVALSSMQQEDPFSRIREKIHYSWLIH